jgi:hypothetical protein
MIPMALDGQMHPCGTNGDKDWMERANSFQRPLIVDLLLELGDPQLLAFHQLESHGAAAYQALGASWNRASYALSPAPGLPCRFRRPGRDARLLQGGDDGATVLFGKIAVEHPVVRPADPIAAATMDAMMAAKPTRRPNFLLLGKSVEPLDEGGQAKLRCVCHGP